MRRERWTDLPVLTAKDTLQVRPWKLALSFPCLVTALGNDTGRPAHAVGYLCETGRMW